MDLNVNPLNQSELEFLDAILEKYRTEGSIENVSELDGFLTAVVSGPNMLLPNQWLPAIWEIETGTETIEWENDTEASRFMTLVMQHMNSNIDMLMEGVGNFEAIFIEVEENDHVYHIADDWCIGYLRGMALGGGWEALPTSLEDELTVIVVHTDDQFQDQLEKLPEDMREALVSKIEPAAEALHHYWLQQRAGLEGMALHSITNPFHAEPKVGRNDPCPCGSGKKFKKCCLH